MSILTPSSEELHFDWRYANYPYDRASCGYCISQHDQTISGWLQCKNPRHAPLKKAATKLVKEIGNNLYPRNEKDVKKFIQIRKRFTRFFRQGKKK
jgi:hypothetical protein